MAEVTTKICANGPCSAEFEPTTNAQIYCKGQCRKRAQLRNSQSRKRRSEKSKRLIDKREIRAEVAELVLYIVTGDEEGEPADTHWHMADSILRAIELRYKL